MTAPTTRPSLTRRLLTDRRLHRDIVRTLLTPHPPEHYVRSLGVDWADDPTGATVVTVDRPVEDVTVLTLRLPAGVERPAPGAALEIGVVIDGVVHRRHYSPVDAATRTDRLATIAVRRHPGGLVSEHLWAEATPGMRLLLGGPAGEMALPEARPADVLLISGGSGITPMLAIASTLAAEGHCAATAAGPAGQADSPEQPRQEDRSEQPRPAGRVAWLHYARRVEDVPFRRQLTELASRGVEIRVIPTAGPAQDDALSREALTGHLTPEHLAAAAPWHANAAVFLCGPETLADGLSDALGADRFADVHRERFSATFSAVPDTDGGTVTHVTSGVTAENPGTTLLEGAEAAGLNPQHGCRMGICHTCTAVRVSGATRDLRTGEVDSEPGCRVQICVSAPVGDVEIEL